MLGYLGRSRAECFDDAGFFHTGDAGHIDEHGELHFDGRRTEMIKTGGANVAPAELEVQLRACQSVKLSKIIGVAHPTLDQIVVACIEPAAGSAPDEAEIRSFLRERVAAYKVPKAVLFFEPGEIPMTQSGTKVNNDALVDLVTERISSDFDFQDQE